MKIQRFARNFSALLATTLLTVAAQAAVTGDAFLVTHDQIFHPEIVNLTPELAGRSLEIAKDSMFTVLGEQVDARGDRLVHLGLDSDDVSLPSEIWVRSTEFDAASIEKLEAGVSVNESTAAMDAFMFKKMTYCYRYVKQYLLKKNLVSRYLPGASAWMAKDYLPQEGFRRTGKGPSAARVNDVCVYSGGNGNNGHIEVLAPSGWYYGYGYSRAPISMNNHRLISCFSKR